MTIPAEDRSHEPPEFWRSLEEREQSPEFLAAVEGEFPGALELWPDDSSRRQFLSRMTASFALAGLAGCVRQPEEDIVPPVERLEHVQPGQSREFATAMPIPGGALGLLVQSRDGRPIKVEGNPQHPASLGATDIAAQASLLNLYDPDRSQVVRRAATISSWAEFRAALTSQVELHRGRNGAGLHLLTPQITSPTLLHQLEELKAAFPEIRWHVFEPFSDESVLAGAELAFGQSLSPRYHLHRADVIFSLDADMLNAGPARVRLAREFASRRRMPASGKGNMNRLYVAESTPTLTGAAADHRLALPPDALPPLLAAIAARLDIEMDGTPQAPPGVPPEWLNAVVEDLQAAGRRGLVVAGPHQPPEVQALCFAINAELGSIGETVTCIEPVDRTADASPDSLADLVTAIDAEEVRSLLIFGVNPVHAAAEDLGFAQRLDRVPFTAHIGLYHDETARRCQWHAPAAHPLEAWSDVRSDDGTVTVLQPLIAPLYQGRTDHEVLNMLLGQSDRSAHETVRSYWQEQWDQANAETRWNRALHDGLIADTAAEPVEVSLASEYQPALPSEERRRGTEELYVLFRPDPSIHDGRDANNGWLQECPKPFTKLTWMNAALISPGDATSRGLTDGDVVELSVNDRTVSLPIVRLPGQPDGVVTVHAGYGRTHAGRNGTGHGVNAAMLQTAAAPWRGIGTLRSTGQTIKLPTTQQHFQMEGRDLIRIGDVKEFQESPQDPAFMHVGGHHAPADHGEDGTDHSPASFYPDKEQEGPQWGMSINLGSCIGCNACVLACQSENNIPIVGPEQVINGREMHWIRVDTYFTGEPEEPTGTHHQPVTCMHCEHAPCEPVCPVAATTHSDEGLNEMTYNRCIGTRYCSNNCPYKVRRFNFLDYQEEARTTPVLQLLNNPEVSVRSRGVMEKCTYCVQRISAARINAKIGERPIADGEVITACQAACPTEAIVFGNIADADSQVARQKAHPLDYGLLTELNTRPRTSYLAALRNPHPGLEQAAAASSSPAVEGGH